MVSDYQSEDESTEVTVTSIIALGFTQIKKTLLALLVGMILLGGYKTIQEYNNPSYLIDNEATEDRLSSITILTTEIEALQNQVNYLNDEQYLSAVMSLKPSTAVKTIITMAVNSENTANQYIHYFNSIEIEKRLRELSSLSIPTVNNIYFDMAADMSADWTENSILGAIKAEAGTKGKISSDENNKNCFMKLTVFGSNEIDTISNAERLYSLIENGKEIITSISGPHELIMIDIFTESGMKEIASIQFEKSVELGKLTDELLSRKKELSKLKNEPLNSYTTPTFIVSVKHSKKWAAIGALIGIFIECLYLVIKFVTYATVISSFEFEKKTNIPYLGSVFTKQSWNMCIADNLLNERVFATDREASAFITENVRSFTKVGSRILITSSFYKSYDEETDIVSYVVEALQKSGYCVEFAGNALTSAEFISKLSKTDEVIILEKRWNSRWQNVITELDMVDRLDKPVKGFIIV